MDVFFETAGGQIPMDDFGLTKDVEAIIELERRKRERTAENQRKHDRDAVLEARDEGYEEQSGATASSERLSSVRAPPELAFATKPAAPLQMPVEDNSDEEEMQKWLDDDGDCD